jgi:hypothetical protein
MTDEMIEAMSAVTDAANDRWNAYTNDNGPVVPWDSRTGWDKQTVRIRTALILDMLARGVPEEEIAEEIHWRWVLRLLEDGWTLGKEKDVAGKVHPCLKPFPQLPPQQQAKCYLAIGIVRALSRAFPGAPCAGMAELTGK